MAAFIVPALTAGATGAAADCPPAVSISGDPVIAGDVRTRLARRGITAMAGSACPVMRVSLSLQEDGTGVLIVDSSHPARERLVRDPAVMASLIESWVRQDVDGPVLGHGDDSPATSSDAVESAGQAALDPELASTHDAASPAPRPTAREFTVGAGLGVDLSPDGSFWLDPSVHGCVGIGPTCVGATVRGRFDIAAWGDSQSTATSRRGVDGLVVAALAFRRGRMEFRPEIGVGAGWLRRRRKATSAGEGGVGVETVGLRLAARLGVGLRVTRGWTLSSAAQILLSPMAQAGPWMEGGVSLAGEPRWSGGIALGLAYGVP